MKMSQAKIIRTFSRLETGSDLSFSMLIRISTVRLTDLFVRFKAGSSPLPAFFFTLYLHSFLSVVTILHAKSSLVLMLLKSNGFSFTKTGNGEHLIRRGLSAPATGKRRWETARRISCSSTGFVKNPLGNTPCADRLYSGCPVTNMTFRQGYFFCRRRAASIPFKPGISISRKMICTLPDNMPKASSILNGIHQGR